MSLFDYNIIIIFTFFPNNTIITLQNVNNSGQMHRALEPSRSFAPTCQQNVNKCSIARLILCTKNMNSTDKWARNSLTPDKGEPMHCASLFFWFILSSFCISFFIFTSFYWLTRMAPDGPGWTRINLFCCLIEYLMQRYWITNWRL